MARLEVCKIRKVSRLEVEDQPLTVGRASDNAIVLSNTHVSRHHCIIEYVDGSPRVRDLGSSTGTFLNGRRISEAPLRHGDRITVGPFDLRFRDPAAPAAPAAPASPASPDSAGTSDISSAAAADSGDFGLADSPIESALGPRHADAMDALLVARMEELDQREAGLLDREAAIAGRESRAVEREAKSLDRETRLARREVELAQRSDKLDRRANDLEAAEQERLRQTALAAEIAASAGSVASSPADAPALAESLAALQLVKEELARLQAESAARLEAVELKLGDSASLLAAADARIDGLEERHAADLKAIEEARTAIEDWRDHAELAEQNLAARTRELDQHVQTVRSLESRIEGLESALEQAQVDHESALDDHRRRVEEQAALGKSLLEQLQQTESQNAADRNAAQEVINLRTRELEARAADLSAREAEMQTLRADIETLQQRLRNAEATKQSTAEKAERAAHVVTTLRHQVHSLDEAAARVTALQDRLAEIEAAWVQVSEQIDEAEEAGSEELDEVVQSRHRMSVELETLNQQRDAAVATLRDSALRLRAITESHAPAEINHDPPSPPSPKPGPRKWWRRGG